MTKQTNEQTVENENLPALPINNATQQELDDPEGVLILDDFTIKMDKDKKRGFLVKYDADWESVDTLPPLALASLEIYWAMFDGTEYKRRDLDDPPPKKEADKWKKHGKLTVYHPKYGQGGFLLAPSGVLSFKSFNRKWKDQGIDVFGKPIKIGSRTAKTKAGFVINVPKFLPGWIHDVTSLPESATNTDDYPVDADNNIPWEVADHDG